MSDEKRKTRKHKLTDEERENLRECQRIKGVSGEAARKIWNIAGQLRPNANVASQTGAKREALDRLRPYLDVYSWHELPCTDGATCRVLIADIVRLLRFAVADSAAYARALEVGIAGAGLTLHPIIYHDEVVCGNILAPLKRKKVLACYISFKEMRCSLHLEAAWLPLLILQHHELDCLKGNLSALCVTMMEAVHSRQATAGFDLHLPGAVQTVKLAASSALLSDQDAQRATYSIKGSAGTALCLYCCNVLSAEHSRDVAGAVPLSEWDSRKFRKTEDASRFAAADQLLQLVRKEDIRFREQATGLNRNPEGLLFHPRARRLLPPSLACVDTLHAYFHNGVASVECFLLVNHLASVGVSLTDLCAAAQEAQWRRPGHGNTTAQNTIKKLLHQKMFEGIYKGQGHETFELVFLLRYYTNVILEQGGVSDSVARSFHLLHACSRELQTLKHAWHALGPADTPSLRQLQSDHQKAFQDAHGTNVMKPKHHHRFHIPDAVEVLGVLPDCALQEKNTRC